MHLLLCRCGRQALCVCGLQETSAIIYLSTGKHTCPCRYGKQPCTVCVLQETILDHSIHSPHAGTLVFAGVKDRPSVYVYSIFHPFFEQYLSIAGNAAFVLLAALLAVMAVTTAFTSSLPLAAILGGCIASLLLNMLGIMVHLGVQLNAVSLVNLTMSIGIAVEFVVHIAQGFLVAPGTRSALPPIAMPSY
jgi:hypothetical protein